MEFTSFHPNFLTNIQAGNSLGECKIALLRVRIQRGKDTKQKSIRDKPKNAKKPIGSGPTE
jgi:hypothetical protein